MPLEMSWYQEHIADPVSQDTIVRRGREFLDKPTQAAVTLARESDVLYKAAQTGKIPLNTAIGHMQVTAFAVGLTAEDNGEDVVLDPLPQDEVSELHTIFEHIISGTPFSPSGNMERDMRRAHIIIGAQTEGQDIDPIGLGHFRDGVQLGLQRWAALTS